MVQRRRAALMSERRQRALVLKGGTVVDGTGASRFAADVRLEGDRIAAVGADLETRDADVHDVAGKIVAPGFIDVHTHDDQILLARRRCCRRSARASPRSSSAIAASAWRRWCTAMRRRRSTCLAATSTSIRRWPRMSQRSKGPVRRSTSPRWSAIRRCGWRRWTILIALPRRPSNRGWSSCCAKAWTRARPA